MTKESSASMTSPHAEPSDSCPAANKSSTCKYSAAVPIAFIASKGTIAQVVFSAKVIPGIGTQYFASYGQRVAGKAWKVKEPVIVFWTSVFTNVFVRKISQAVTKPLSGGG
eukprot:CAMPEP_0169272124 /NCGR_PEP_ID=MMETSP1016-20121227/50216_1 /TAXON_ID=342587 /ORGANISM="Karlodinium micrum, Strain CCMP2283" /LENGTH=110 /DNA_ID=CAMNT_0009357981 /DNA_START=242 /DNA_END=578 /DNA_ORIENTATION=+